MQTLLISLIIGFIFSLINIKIQSKIALKPLTMNNSEETAAEAFMLGPVISRTAIVYATIGTVFGYLLLGPAILKLISLIAIPAFSISSIWFLRIATKNYLNDRPWLLDFTNYYKTACLEYMKLCDFLKKSNKESYKKLANNLWAEIVDLNHRKHVALERIKQLQALKADVIKLLDKYSYYGENEKKERTQNRLRKIEEEIGQTEVFAKEVDEHMKRAETIFLDVRSNVALGDSERIATDISELTGKVKALEYTVNALEE